MSSAPSSLGLLSGYNSSSSDEDEVVENTACATRSNLNSLVDATSTSEDKAKHHNKKDAIETSEPLPCIQFSFRLPAPCLGTQSGLSSGSVFSNPFQDEQQAQRTILERHVKLSDGNWAKGGKGTCLAYQRDGRCRFGTKCKYSHGTDLPQETTISTQREIQGKELGDEAWEAHPGGNAMTGDGQNEVQTEKGKRKKPGLTNTLIPPKKTLKNYEKQLSSERPWAL